MKITKSQLKRIIKEELESVLMEEEEREWPGPGNANWMPGAVITRETGGWHFPDTWAGEVAKEWYEENKDSLEPPPY